MFPSALFLKLVVWFLGLCFLKVSIPVLVVVSPPLFLLTLPFAQGRGSIKHIDNEGEVRSGPRLLGVGHPVPSRVPSYEIYGCPLGIDDQSGVLVDRKIYL